MLTKILTGLVALVIVGGVVAIVLHHGPATTTTSLATTTTSITTTSITTTTSPSINTTTSTTVTTTPVSTIPGPTIPLSQFSAACNQALVPARAVLVKAKSGKRVTRADAGRLARSVSRAFKVCTIAEYNTFTSLELNPYLAQNK